MAYYYVPDSTKASITEIFDVHDNESGIEKSYSNLQLNEDVPLISQNTDDWDDQPKWMVEQNG